MQPAVIYWPTTLPYFRLQSAAAAAAAATTTTVTASLPREQNPKQRQRHPPLKSNSNPQRQITASIVNSDHAKGESSLRGSDVLLALQRAATLKKKKKNHKRKTNRQSEKGEEEVQDLDYDNIRPINVLSEWKERIAELETRVQELKSQYHY